MAWQMWHRSHSISLFTYGVIIRGVRRNAVRISDVLLVKETFWQCLPIVHGVKKFSKGLERGENLAMRIDIFVCLRPTALPEDAL